jgi:integrase
MGSKRITKRAVDGFTCPPGKDRAFLWDDALSGFGVVAYPPKKVGGVEKSKKAYVIQFRQKGRSRRMTVGDHGRLPPDQARSLAKTLLGAVEAGADPIGDRRTARSAKTFSEVWAEYYRLQVLPKRKARTAEEYERLAKLHLIPTFGSQIMADIKKVDVTRLHAKMSDRPGAANRTLALFSGVWNWAAGQGELARARNPASGIERYPEKPKERYLSAAELARLGDVLRLAETTGLPWAVDDEKATAKHIPKANRVTKLDIYAVAAIRLLIFTGARLREILHAKWDYVDWQRGLMHLPDSKTGRKTLYLSAPALAVLQAIHPAPTTPYIIPGLIRRKEAAGKQGPEPMPRSDLKKPWAAITRVAGLQGVRIHDLRHSFAATGAGASLGLPMIGKLLGQKQPSTTARYAHLDADPMRRAANTIGAQIAAAMGTPVKKPDSIASASPAHIGTLSK